jgi:DNA-directed RNA polymerase specialized sigma24 family protein
MTATMESKSASSEPEIGEAFLTHLPRIREHARYALRHVSCPDTRDELTAEVIALAWKRFSALARRGKRPEEFITTLALRCSQAVRGGRRLCECDSSEDVLSPVARVRGGFAVAEDGERLSNGPDHGGRRRDRTPRVAG